jgi:hypothetical protein
VPRLTPGTRLGVALGALALLLAGLVGLGVRAYDGNVSALLHLYRPAVEPFDVPPGLVLYEDGGYDGMKVWLVARGLPRVLGVGGEGEGPLFAETYRYQRVLLPALGLLVAGGDEDRLPAALLAINVVAVLATFALFVVATGRWSLHALALATNPAALLGVVYVLTEPLAILCTTAFLVVWRRGGERVSAAAAIPLALALLARETTLFVTLPLAAFLALRRQWRDVAFTLASTLPFAAWSAFLAFRFAEVSLEGSTRMVNLPLSGSLALLADLANGVTVYGLSALAFLVLVALPVLVFTVSRVLREGAGAGATTVMLASLVGLLFCLDAHIWSVLTAVGRVVPSLYPVFAFAALEKDGPLERAASAGMILVGVVGAVGVALTVHPFTISR